jgi:hypothetical protein
MLRFSVRWEVLHGLSIESLAFKGSQVYPKTRWQAFERLFKVPNAIKIHRGKETHRRQLITHARRIPPSGLAIFPRPDVHTLNQSAAKQESASHWP